MSMPFSWTIHRTRDILHSYHESMPLAGTLGAVAATDQLEAMIEEAGGYQPVCLVLIALCEDALVHAAHFMGEIEGKEADPQTLLDLLADRLVVIAEESE